MSASRRYEVLWAVPAQLDLQNIIEYLVREDPTLAARILRELREAAATLRTLPDRGRVLPELQRQGISLYRELIHEPWRIIYRVESRRVYVLAVLDARRNVEDLLLERLVRGG